MFVLFFAGYIEIADVNPGCKHGLFDILQRDKSKLRNALSFEHVKGKHRQLFLFCLFFYFFFSH